MTSLMTNTAAMTALSTLQMTNKSLDDTQNRISTGYRVSQASDNAAYWSIATTMRSDNKSLSAVKDSLGIGAATVDTAYTGMTAAKDVLDEIKAKLTTASQDGVDKSKVQDELSQLQDQLKGIAGSASFSGQNWLSVDSSATGYSANKSFVSSFSRDNNGTLSLGNINVDTSSLALFNASTTTSGILEKNKDTAKLTAIDTAFKAATAGTATAGGVGTSGSLARVTYASTQDFTLGANDEISFSVTIDGGSKQTFKITKDVVDAALGTTDGVVGSDASYGKVMQKALANIQGATVDATGKITSSSQGTGSTVAMAAGDTSVASVGVADIDLTKAGITADDIKGYINKVDSALSMVTAGASTLGAVKTRIDLQTTFVGNLMDTIDKGVGTLVDADMTAESSRLKALQTQQQLGVQALSIANSSSQSLLSLFR